MPKFILSLLLLLMTSSFAGEIAKNANETSPLEVDTKVKNSKTYDASGEKTSMKKMLREGNAVFVFFRGQWCPFCMRHLNTFKDLPAKLKKVNAKLYIVSAEAPKTAKKLQKRFPEFTVLSDNEGELMADFGIAFKSGRGILPVPAVYLVEKKSKKVVFAFSDKNYRNRLAADKIAEALKNFK